MKQRVLLALWVATLFGVCLVLNTRHNQFPWHYHPDEPGKVEQVMSGEWNFHHPFLMLGTARLAVNASSHPLDEQQVVVLGRTISAIFTAGAVVMLSLLGYCWRGWLAGILTGVLLATHHQLYELSHYFKEDPALLLGFATTILALWLYSDKPSALRAAFLGLGCALAISAKYLGAVSLLLAIPVMIKRPAGRGWWTFGGVFLASVALINWPLFAALGTFRESFGREMNLVVKGQGGTTQRIPHAEYWTIFRDNTTPAMWGLLLFFLGARWRERRTLTLAEWMLAAFPFVYALALSFSPKTNDRYFLPATAWFCLQAAIGASDVVVLWHRRAIWPAVALVLVAAQFPDWSASHPGWLSYDRAFQVDDNADLITYLRTSVPPDAVILKDNRIALPDPEKKKHAARVGVIPQKVIAKRYAADAGSFESLRSKGITHVIVTETDYGKFFRASLHAQKGEEAGFAKRREFYSELFAESEPIWERERGTVIYLHPGIRIYPLR